MATSSVSAQFAAIQNINYYICRVASVALPTVWPPHYYHSNATVLPLDFIYYCLLPFYCYFAVILLLFCYHITTTLITVLPLNFIYYGLLPFYCYFAVIWLLFCYHFTTTPITVLLLNFIYYGLLPFYCRFTVKNLNWL